MRTPVMGNTPPDGSFSPVKRMAICTILLDLSRELFDTRIPPGETVAINYAQKVPRPGLMLRAMVTVYPDHFYTRFFQATLANGQVSKGRAPLQQALKRPQASPFVLFQQELPVE